MIECDECGREFDNRQALGAHKQSGHGQPWRDEELLEELYVERDLSVTELAEKFDVSTTTIIQWRDKFGLEKKYKDKDLLRELYVEEGMKISEIAGRLGVTSPPIQRRLAEMDVETRIPQEYMDRPWENKQTFKRLYCEEGLSYKEMSERLGCGITTLQRWRDEHGLEPRGPTIGDRVERCGFYTSKTGYERAQTAVGDTTKQIGIHRLVAVAEYGIDAVKGMVVHHENEIPWDNRKENLTPMKRADHTAYHNTKEAKK